MATNFRSPPLLTEDKVYNDWKKEIEFWKIATDVKEEKQAAQIFLTLTGRAREAVLEMSATEIGVKEGVENLIKKLDELYKEDSNQAAFIAYEQFESFKRPENMSIKDYINAFERLNNKLKTYEMNLPEGVLAYRLLRSANISKENEQLARATIKELTFKEMCTQLKLIFGDCNVEKMSKNMDNVKLEGDRSIKLEPTFYEREEEDAFYNRNSGAGRDGIMRNSRGGSNSSYREDNRRNYRISSNQSRMGCSRK